MPPVDPGPFQTIVEVGWSNKPRLLILKLYMEAPYGWDDGFGPIGAPSAYNFSCRIISDLVGGETRFGNWRALDPLEGSPEYRNNNYLGEGEAYREVGFHSGKQFPNIGTLQPQWGTSIAIDLELVRQSFIVTSDEQTSAAEGDGVFPLDMRVEISAGPAGVAEYFSQSVELTAELYRGGRGEVVELTPALGVKWFSALETRGSPIIRTISSTMVNDNPAENTNQFGAGSLMETLIVGLKEMTLEWEAALT